MVPKLHAKGSSFKGIAAYVLHDKGNARTAQRVAWTETRNLATGNPDLAWKIMAATAMDQARLKEQAGVKKTGRKSYDAVLHFTLSWHPEEKGALNREEMLRAAHGAIRALGASDRQAMIVHHKDEPQPHIHIIVNRVSSEDGRMLSSSKEKLELSKWAEKYEQERGVTYCKERVLNNEARKRDEYTRGKKDRARNILETEREAANDNYPDANAVREAQRRKDAALEQNVREQKERQRQAWEKLQQDHKARAAEIKAKAQRDAQAQETTIREKYRPQWTTLLHEREVQMRDFERREKTFLGRFKNVLGTVDMQAIIHGKERGKEEGRGRGQAIGEAFRALASSGVRLEGLKRQQEAAQRELARRQKREEEEALRRVKATREDALQKSRATFEKQRNDLILTQSLEGAKVRAERKTRNEQRGQAWEEWRKGKDRFERGHAPDHIEPIPSIRDRFERSAGNRFERPPGRDRDRE